MIVLKAVMRLRDDRISSLDCRISGGMLTSKQAMYQNVFGRPWHFRLSAQTK